MVKINQDEFQLKQVMIFYYDNDRPPESELDERTNYILKKQNNN